jgi:hypothetical protein
VETNSSENEVQVEGSDQQSDEPASAATDSTVEAESQQTSDPTASAREREQAQENARREKLVQFFAYLGSGECRSLPGYRELSAELRMTPAGLFVGEDILPKILALFDVGLRDVVKISEYDERKKNQLLFKRFYPDLYYLTQGKSCLAGFLIPFPTSSPQGFKLPVFAGEPMAAKTFLHPRDPALENVSFIQISSGDESRRYCVTAEEGEQKLYFSDQLLQLISTLREDSQFLRQRYPRAGRSRRDLLLATAKLLSKAQPLPSDAEERALVPAGKRGDPAGEVLCRGKLRFLVDADDRVVECYEIGTRSFGDFLIRSFGLLHAGFWQKRRGTLERAGKPDRGLFYVLDSSNERLLVTLPALRDFVQTLLHDLKVAPDIGKRCTFEGALDALAALFRRSIWVMNADVPQATQERFRGNPSFRKVLDCFLGIEQRSRIVGFSSPFLVKLNAKQRNTGNFAKPSSGQAKQVRPKKQGRYEKRPPKKS